MASIQSVPEALSLGVKRTGRKANHLPPSSAEVKKAWSYTFTPQYVFIACCLVKHRGNFTLRYLTVFRHHYHIITHLTLAPTGWIIGCSSPGRGWEFFSPPPFPNRFWTHSAS